VGAVALRFSVFSPDAICGITPIELMLEIQEFDKSRRPNARTPDKTPPAIAAASSPVKCWAAGLGRSAGQLPSTCPHDDADRNATRARRIFASRAAVFEPLFPPDGHRRGAGRRGRGKLTTKPVAGWENSLQPGEAVAGVLVSGDMSATGMGTVTYNDGKRVLGLRASFLQSRARRHAHGEK